MIFTSFCEVNILAYKTDYTKVLFRTIQYGFYGLISATTKKSQNLLTTHNIFFPKKYKHVHPSCSHIIVAQFVLKKISCWPIVCYK